MTNIAIMNVCKQLLSKTFRWTTSRSKHLPQGFSSSRRPLATAPPGQFVDVDGHKIHYEMLGHGDHVVLFMPGALSSARMDFGPQLDLMDRNKFTVIGWDPPGYGFSRPPERTFPFKYLHRDADVAKKFLDKLGIAKVSVVGWCNGASTAIIFAGQNPGLMHKLVACAGYATLTEEDLQWNDAHRAMDAWSEHVVRPKVDFYGEQHLLKMWNECLDALKTIYTHNDGDVCLKEAKMVQCPTLLLRGTRDPVISRRHFEILTRTVTNSRSFEIEGGNHEVQQQSPDQFNKVVTSFLLQ